MVASGPLIDDQNTAHSLVASGSLIASDSLIPKRNASDSFVQEQNAPDRSSEGDEKLKLIQENESLKRQLELSENDKACFQS